MSATPVAVRLTANFERDLAEIENFLSGAEALPAYDALLDELLDTVVPNLERFPGMGRPFFSRVAHSVEAGNALDALRTRLAGARGTPEGLREYVMDRYIVLYLWSGRNVHLLAIKHHRQLSFDFEALWGR